MGSENLRGKALQIIYLYWVEHDHQYPTSGEIARSLKKTSSHWSNLRKTMIAKGLLLESPAWGIELTDLAFSMMQANENKDDGKTTLKLQTLKNEAQNRPSLASKLKTINHEFTGNLIDIPLFGAVKAGIGNREDDLAVYGSSETCSAPENVGDPTKVFAMRVEGESMIHEGIYPGDYVIVEKVPLIRLSDGDLVIAKYLSNDYINKRLPEIEAAIQADNLYGPTLKYFNKLQRGDKRPSYRLSWKTDSDASDFKIDTPYISPDETGRVIAVYTPQRFRRLP